LAESSHARGGPAACLEEEALLAFGRGELGRDELAAAELHVDSCVRCRVAFAEAVTAQHGLAQSPSPATGKLTGRLLSPASLQPGALLGRRYRIARFVGRGGMGEVYEAEDTMLGNRIALKIVPVTASDNPKAMSRLKAEALLARKVTHRNVCRVFDVGVDESGLFLTMELLAGESLAARLRRGRFTEEEVIAPALQMAAGLAEAHAAGIVHRDFKSDNVMLCADSRSAEGDVRVVVTDFGLARAILADPDTPTVSTESGVVVGSVGYMAPEQVTGKGGIGPAADIFAFGVVLFEMITGRLPFLGRTPIETALMRVRGPAPTPRSVDPALDARWDALLARCLARDPAARFGSMVEVSDAIAGEGGSPVAAGARFLKKLGSATTRLMGRGRSPRKR
jgi:serine/threonine protein kinase